ncbi:ribosomal RNA-processing protein 14-C-like [Humulus lupulus]|uniref:ribosomal RNA-processing protein 14-C-like n=1 Tax=Humulus lupulus TaxID=3486 RepID=UPI002B416576|nr:ribosomal RNA-processing protein 14-C-like [Humulus lupulus]XP_062113322.1 ribosomal RNA-processing protein 14-C-like [Humulus lupulus]
MKKKKVKSGGESSTVVDLKSLIHNHSLFFDKLVELIPAKFYLPTDDKDKPWYQGLSKAQKASAKKEARENIKKARRNRLDPDKSSATTLDLLKESLEKEKKDVESDDKDETETKPVLSGLDDDNRSVTYEELRQRLRRRIEEFQSSRNTGDSEPRITKRYERNERRSIEYKKRKRENESGDKAAAETGISEKKVEKDIEEASKVLSFGHVKLSNDEEHEKKKRRVSKAKELERAKKLEEAKNDPEKGEIISKKHSWDAATSRAAGKKVHDDPKLLKQSLHKEKKKQQKNAEKWKERVQTTEKLKSERQQKRSQNIELKKQDKKQRRIAKREKKLMRPGFEGRKEGFINEKSA